jgi:hypothetical protein
MTTKTSTNFWLDVVSLIVMIGLTATGGLIHFVLPAGTGHFYVLFGWNRHDIGQLHFYLAVAAVALLALHVLLHWNWICCVIAKMVGKNAPSQKSQAIWGIILLLLIAVLLGGGLFCASALIQRRVPEGGGRGRRAHLNAVFPSQAAWSFENTMKTSAPTDEPSPAAPLGKTQPKAQRANGASSHIEKCPAGASIDGRTTLIEAARICRVSIEQLTNQLGLPPGIDSREHLGRLKWRYGIDLHAVRRIACR